MSAGGPPIPKLSDLPPEYVAENNSGRVLAANSIILVLTTFLYVLRLYARTLTKAKRGWDEFLLIPAYILMLGLFICVYLEVTIAGLGQHTVVLLNRDPKQIENYLKLLYILDWFYVPANALSRISVVILYLRIFTSKTARLACWFVIAFLTGNCVATIIAAQIECIPLEFTWNKNLPGGGKCFNMILWYQLSNFPNVAADLMILVLPIRTVWTLKASTARKTGIAAVCLTGSIGLIASVVRTITFYRDADLFANDPNFADASFSWTSVECGMYFSAACLIGLRPLFSRLPQWLKSRVLSPSEQGQSRNYTSGGTHLRSKKGGTYASIVDGKESAMATHSTQLRDLDSSAMGKRSPSDSDADSLSRVLPQAHYGRPNPPPKDDPFGRDIRVQTEIEVRRESDGFYRQYP